MKSFSAKGIEEAISFVSTSQRAKRKKMRAENRDADFYLFIQFWVDPRFEIKHYLLLNKYEIGVDGRCKLL